MKRSFSPSRYLQYARCGKQFELTRLHRLAEPEAWYLIGGKSVHLATEMYDKGDTRKVAVIWEEAFDKTYSDAFQRDPFEDEWLTSKGYSGRAQPERYAEWQVKGLEAVENWVRWRAAHRTWELLEIEHELRIEEPFTFHGFVDRLFAKGSHRIIVDLKTGSRKSDTPFQLGTYATVYELLGEPRPKYGLFWYSKYGDQTQDDLLSLDTYNIHVITEMERMLWAGVENKVFLPVISSQCRYCPASDACYAWSGDTAMSRKYDPLNPTFGSSEDV